MSSGIVEKPNRRSMFHFGSSEVDTKVGLGMLRTYWGKHLRSVKMEGAQVGT